MNLEKRTLKVLLLANVIYIVLNIVTVFMQTRVGLVSYFFWGFIGPIIASIVYWIYLNSVVSRRRDWIIISIVISLMYLMLGYLSLYHIVGIWASI